MSLTLLFFEGGSPVAAATYAKIIILTNGHLAMHLGGPMYQEL